MTDGDLRDPILKILAKSTGAMTTSDVQMMLSEIGIEVSPSQIFRVMELLADKEHKLSTFTAYSGYTAVSRISGKGKVFYEEGGFAGIKEAEAAREQMEEFRHQQQVRAATWGNKAAWVGAIIAFLSLGFTIWFAYAESDDHEEDVKQLYHYIDSLMNEKEGIQDSLLPKGGSDSLGGRGSSN